MGRRKRPIRKAGTFRDAKLIIIACEDAKATPTYLNGMVQKYRNPKIHVEVLKRESPSKSAPAHILDQLDTWSKTYQINVEQGDELWLVADTDRYELSDIVRQCQQKGIHTAISNPCVELWFLLHHQDVSILPKHVQSELEENKKVNKNRTRLEEELREILGQYNKSKLKVDDFIPHTQTAINNAIKLDDNTSNRWPQTLGTDMHKLIRSMIDITKTE